MHWFYTTFQDYCKKSGIQLLKDDLKYIERVLCNIDKGEQKRVLKHFTDEWLLGIQLEENSTLKQNTGRRRANLWLLEKVNEIKNGENRK